MFNNQNLKYGYKLGYYKKPHHKTKEVLIYIEILESSKIIDNRQHEIYDFIKTDIVKIVKIEGLDGSIFENAYFVKDPEFKYDVKQGEIVRFKHSEFTNETPDQSYISFYTTKTGALNNSSEIDKDQNGTKIYYYKNAKIKEKIYYVLGSKTHIFGYYDNEFNSLHYTWTIQRYVDQIFPTIREYIYNQQENPIAQYIINEGKITKKIIYDHSDNNDSIYLQN